MTFPEAADLLDHIRDAALQASNYVEGMTKLEFDVDRRTQQAVILNLVVIGEAATKLLDRFPDTAAQFPEVQWQAMRGMRNRIAHGYYEIDLDVVWDTVIDALPDLLIKLP